MNLKLSVDEKDEIESLIQSQGWDALLKVIEQLCQDQEKLVLLYNLGEGQEGLVLAKARTEGARKLFRDITALKQFRKVKK